MQSNPKTISDPRGQGMTLSGYWTTINRVEYHDAHDGSVSVVRVLADGTRKPITKRAPDMVTAMRWYEPLIGCKAWVRS